MNTGVEGMTESEDERNRREHIRVPGPFNGRRRGALTFAVHIHDLSIGGCLIQSFHEVKKGQRLTLDIELPYEGWITVDAIALYTRDDYGFAVEFVDVPEMTRFQLELAIQRLVNKAPGAE